MRRPILWMIRCLALGHYAWGIALLLLAAWFATSAFRILPHMSTGTIWTNLPKAMMLAVTQAGPLGMLGMWIVVLGHWTWTGHAGLRTALLWTHGLLLFPGFLAFVSASMHCVPQREVPRKAAGYWAPSEDSPWR